MRDKEFWKIVRDRNESSFPRLSRAQTRELLMALEEMEQRMTQEFDNLKLAVGEAVTTIVAAIDRISKSDNPAEIQAEADKLNASVADLKTALGV